MSTSLPKIIGILNVTPDSFYANSRLDTVQAAVLKNKLKSIMKINDTRRKLANFYDKNLKIRYKRNPDYFLLNQSGAMTVLVK